MGHLIDQFSTVRLRLLMVLFTSLNVKWVKHVMPLKSVLMTGIFGLILWTCLLLWLILIVHYKGKEEILVKATILFWIAASGYICLVAIRMILITIVPPLKWCVLISIPAAL